MNSQMNKACTIAGDFNSIMTKDEENNCKLILFEKILDCYKKGSKPFIPTVKWACRSILRRS